MAGDQQRETSGPQGPAHTGGVSTAAGVIVAVRVFGSYALLPDRMLKQAGFAMAIEIVLDSMV